MENLDELELEDLFSVAAITYKPDPIKANIRKEIGKVIAMDRLDSAEATRIFCFLDCYKYVPKEKQQVHKELSSWISDWLYAWSSRFCDLSNYPHSFLYRASMVCMQLSHFYTWEEQDQLYQELKEKEFPVDPLDSRPD